LLYKQRLKKHTVFLTPGAGAINLDLMGLKMLSNLVFVRTSDAEDFMVKALRMTNSEEPSGDDGC